jgi:hypothetical protein
MQTSLNLLGQISFLRLNSHQAQIVTDHPKVEHYNSHKTCHHILFTWFTHRAGRTVPSMLVLGHKTSEFQFTIAMGRTQSSLCLSLFLWTIPVRFYCIHCVN